MLHNLKRMSVFGIRILGANSGQNSNTMRKSIISRAFASHRSKLVKCWKCGSENGQNGPQFQCNKCSSLIDIPDNLDPFEVLNLKKDFDIDLSQATAHFRRLQTIVHPDKFSNRSEKEKDLSAEWSALVNKAYSIVTSHMARAELLLKDNNIEITENTTVSNKMFLMEMMERNEEIDEAETETDLVKLLESARKDFQKGLSDLEASFKENKLLEAKEILISMRYLLSIENTIKEKANRLGINL